MVVDLPVSGDGRNFPSGGINVDAVIAAFSQKLTAVRFEMTDQFTTLHGPASVKVSRMQSFPRGVSSARARLDSRTRAIASFQVGSRFFEGGSLGIGSGQLFDERDIAFGHLLINGG